MFRLSAPLGVQIELTNGCTQRCRHCYNFWRFEPINREGELSSDDFLRILGILNEAQVSNINLTGGEPLLRRDVVFSLLNQGVAYGMEIGLNTNGVLMTRSIARQLANQGLDHALVSLLGTEATHNQIAGTKSGFRRTCAAVQYLAEAGIPVGVNMVVSTMNHGEVYAVGRLARELGADTYSATPMIPSHPSNVPYTMNGMQTKAALRELIRACRDFDLIIDVLEPIPRCLFGPDEEGEFLVLFGRRLCLAGIAYCVISSRGTVRPCPHADVEFGNILQDGMPTAWERMREWSDAAMLPPECQGCHANIICEGGCRMSARMTCGRYDGPDYLMVGPITDLDRVAKYPWPDQSPLDLAGSFHVHPRCRFRREAFGMVAFIGDEIEFVSTSGAELLDCLRNMTSFTLADVAEKMGYESRELGPIFSRLLARNILQPEAVSEKGGDK